MKSLAKKYGCNAIAIQCWNALQDEINIMPCAANSLLNEEGIPVVCETDIHGTISQLIAEAASMNERRVMFSDWTVRHPDNENGELLQHCGPWPISVAKEKPSICVPVAFPQNGAVSAEAKHGLMSLVRFDGDGGEYSILLGHAKGIDGPFTRGTYVWIEVNNLKRLEAKFVLSKGHCVETLYAVLAYEGFMNLDEVKAKFSKFGSEYIGHPHNTLPGIEMNSGSLGHGLSVSVGMALAGKMDGKNYRVYTLMGDGELAEGSVWEGAAAGGHYRLDNLCAFVDHNHLQILGNVDEVLSPGNIALRFEASGWNVINVMNGNDIQQISDALDVAERTKGKPTVIIAETLKGKASPLIENKAGWHHKLPTQEEYERISADIAAYKEAIING